MNRALFKYIVKREKPLPARVNDCLLNLDAVAPGWSGKNITVCADYIEPLLKGDCVLFLGTPGSGKTIAACCLAMLYAVTAFFKEHENDAPVPLPDFSDGAYSDFLRDREIALTEREPENKTHEEKIPRFDKPGEYYDLTVSTPEFEAYRNRQAIKELPTDREKWEVSSLIKWSHETHNTLNFGNRFSFITANELIQAKEQNHSDYLIYKRNPRVLIIDDMGWEKTLSYGNSVLTFWNEIIDRRYSQMLPTIITANLGNGEIKEKYRDRIYDRLYQWGHFINLVGEKSLRQSETKRVRDVIW